jgi:hypothetical protein
MLLILQIVIKVQALLVNTQQLLLLGKDAIRWWLISAAINNLHVHMILGQRLQCMVTPRFDRQAWNSYCAKQQRSTCTTVFELRNYYDLNTPWSVQTWLHPNLTVRHVSLLLDNRKPAGRLTGSSLLAFMSGMSMTTCSCESRSCMQSFAARTLRNNHCWELVAFFRASIISLHFFREL